MKKITQKIKAKLIEKAYIKSHTKKITGCGIYADSKPCQYQIIEDRVYLWYNTPDGSTHAVKTKI